MRKETAAEPARADAPTGTASPAALAREVTELFSPLSTMIKKKVPFVRPGHSSGSEGTPTGAAGGESDDTRRLQRVLEETMLKNQQLQEMVRRLGDEVDRLHTTAGPQRTGPARTSMPQAGALPPPAPPRPLPGQ
jgi:hypothetical protein